MVPQKYTESRWNSLAKSRPVSSSIFVIVLNLPGSVLWALQGLLLPKGQLHPLAFKGPLMTIPAQHVPLCADTSLALHIWHLAFSTQYHRMTFCGYDKNLPPGSQCITSTKWFSNKKHIQVCLSSIVVFIPVFKVKLSHRVSAKIMKLKRADMRLQPPEYSKYPLLCLLSIHLASPRQSCL